MFRVPYSLPDSIVKSCQIFPGKGSQDHIHQLPIREQHWNTEAEHLTAPRAGPGLNSRDPQSEEINDTESRDLHHEHRSNGGVYEAKQDPRRFVCHMMQLELLPSHPPPPFPSAGAPDHQSTHMDTLDLPSERCRMHAGLWLGGIFGIAHVDSFGCTHILSTISDLNVGEELEQTGRRYVVRLPDHPGPRHRPFQST